MELNQLHSNWRLAWANVKASRSGRHEGEPERQEVGDVDGFY
jgi:hypothetical protein